MLKKNYILFLLFILPVSIILAQMPSCPSPYVWMDGGPLIKYYDPNQPLSSTNPATINVPTFGSGLTLMPNINGGTLSPTFYSVSGGNYWYWSGTAWVNTGHSTGSGAAVNIAGCGNSIYNLVGGSGQVYVYNGTTSGSLLTTLQGFSGGGPYDLVADCNCNFYALRTATPNAGLTMYNSSGVPQCTYTLSGMPNASSGGGFAIIGTTIFVKNNIANPGGFYIGNISGGGITFTSVPGFTNSPGDFASCPVCYQPSNLNNVNISSGMLTCNIQTVNLAVTTTLSSLSYSWSGPGIIGPVNGTMVTVNAVGIYTCVVSAGGCPPSVSILTTAVTSNSSVVMANISPSGTICVPSFSVVPLVVAHSSSTDVISWSGPGIISGSGTGTINTNSPGVYSVNVTDPYNGCTNSDFVTIAWNPTVALSLSNYSLCAQAINGSPASITITASGAATYTLLTNPQFSTSAPNGTVMPVFPVPPYPLNTSVYTATLLGTVGLCTNSTTASFSIIPNPVVSIIPPSASICPGSTQQFSATGASIYSWVATQGLNPLQGSTVIANPFASFSTYSVMGSSYGCNSSVEVASLTVKPLPSIILGPATSTICLGSATTLSVTGDATSYNWKPAASLSSSSGSVVNAIPSNNQIYTVVGSLNSCTTAATATVYIVQPPILSMQLSSSSVCANNFNHSPNSITVSPSGANSYTLLGGNSFNVIAPHGPFMQLVPSGQQQNSSIVQTTTLIGVSGICSSEITKTFVIVPNPVVNIPASTASICPGKNHIFNVNGATTYTWLAAPGLTVLTQTSVIVSPKNTSYFSVFGSSLGCNSDNKNAIVIVLPVPKVEIVPATSTVCAGKQVTLTALSNGISHTWSPSTGLSSSSGTFVTASPPNYQQYTLTAAFNTCTNYAVASVSVISIPVLSVVADDYTLCIGSGTKLRASGANSFSWSPYGSLDYPSGNVVTASPNQSTTYTVQGYNGICTGSANILIKTHERPDIKIIAEQNQVCRGSTLPLRVSGANSYSWAPMQQLWIQDGGSLVIASPTANTNFTISGTTSIGTVQCYQQISYSVMVTEPVKPVVSGSAAICSGDKITLTASGGNTFNWRPTIGLNINNQAGVVANPTISTVYTVDISHDTFCGNTATVFVEVNPRPVVFAGNDTIYNLNEAIFIEAIGTGTIHWISGEAIVCPACNITQVYPTRYTCYIAEAVNEHGCKAQDELCLNITEDFSVYIPNVFTPNNDGLNDVFYVYGENISNVSMEIFDRWGLLIFYSDNQLIGWDGTFKSSACQSGDYTYKIKYTGLNRKNYTRVGHVILNR